MEQKFQYVPKQKREDNVISNITPVPLISTSSTIDLFTIGYGSTKFEDFTNILKQNNISLLADVRISPNGGIDFVIYHL